MVYQDISITTCSDLGSSKKRISGRDSSQIFWDSYAATMENEGPYTLLISQRCGYLHTEVVCEIRGSANKRQYNIAKVWSFKTDQEYQKQGRQGLRSDILASFLRGAPRHSNNTITDLSFLRSSLHQESSILTPHID